MSFSKHIQNKMAANGSKFQYAARPLEQFELSLWYFQKRHLAFWIFIDKNVYNSSR